MIPGGVDPIQSYGRGLQGLVVGRTEIGRVDPAGALLYRGVTVEELAAEASFEEVAHLVLYGHREPEALERFRGALRRWRVPPRQAFDALTRVPETAHPLALYRTMVTVAACHAPEIDRLDAEAQARRPARLLAWSAALAAGAIRHMGGEAPVEARDDLGFSANFLWQTLGREATEEEVRAFDVSLIVQAEHGLHAAAFAALVATSAGADLGSAVLAGMGALSGERHGGANQLAYEILESLSSPEQARDWAREQVGEGFRFPGFGHRVYKAPDPRVRVLEPYAERMLTQQGLEGRWKTFLALREEVEAALGPKGIFANVDALTGLVYRPLGLPVAAFPIPFALAIQTGWMAHCLEYQAHGGPMIEPGAVYLDRNRP